MGGGILIGDNNKLSKIENTKISYLTGYEKEQNPEFLILGSINFHQTKCKQTFWGGKIQSIFSIKLGTA